MTALVTGGAKGLGAEICRTLARSGYSIVCHYNTSPEAAEAVAKEGQTTLAWLLEKGVEKNSFVILVHACRKPSEKQD